MPQNVPQSSSKPYDTVGTVLQFARAYVADMEDSIAGDLLANDQPYTPILLNSAWQRLQDDLIDNGVETLVKEIIISSVPTIFLSDPSVNVFLAWDGYCNGESMVDNPNLPNDLVIPSQVWQRPAGNSMPFVEVPAGDGHTYPRSQTTAINWWEWRDDKLFMSGSTAPVDLRLRYVAYLDVLAGTNEEGVPTVDERVQVPIMRSARALAYLLAAEFAAARGASGAQQMEANAQREINRIANRTAKRKAVVQYRRRAFGQ